jgi:hypothetical protein
VNIEKTYLEEGRKVGPIRSIRLELFDVFVVYMLLDPALLTPFLNVGRFGSQILVEIFSQKLLLWLSKFTLRGAFRRNSRRIGFRGRLSRRRRHGGSEG